MTGMRDLKDGLRALVRLDFSGRVHKTYRGSGVEERFAREVEVLRVLEERGCDYVPRLLEAHPEELRIVTTSCGAPAPNITRKKATDLFWALERDFGVRHDDPEPRNVTYSAVMGRFCLIDFELAEILPAPGGVEEGFEPAADQTWRVSWRAVSQTGKKHDANDDFWSVLGVTPDGAFFREDRGEELLDPEHTMLAMSDGMGGRNAGELASHLVLKWLRSRAVEIYQSMTRDPSDTSLLEEVVREVHHGLNQLAEGDEKAAGMGATLTLAYVTPGFLTVAHIGDSRLYLRRDGETTLLTKDTTAAFSALKAGRITEYAFRNHPRRAALYDSLGGGHASIQPQFFSQPIEHHDRLLLCTDGIVDGLWERTIGQELAAGTAEQSAKSLVKRAVENDGQDDCTLIVADLARV